MTWVRNKDTGSALTFAYLLASLQIVLTSALLHPWYVIWIIPFLALFPSPAWLYFSLAVSISYLAYVSPGQMPPEWVRHMEYIPFFGLLAAEYLVLLKSPGGRFPWRPTREQNPQILQGFL